MVIYLAGNFPALSKKENEMVIVNNIKKADANYHRLVTFFYPKYVNTVIQIVREELNEPVS
jgi:hypothetical protein